MSTRILVAAIVAVVTGLIPTAQAQSFPSKAVRIIVPFPPGGAGDTTTRMLVEHLRVGLGQTVIVDNRPGAGAVIGYELGARAPGDGHTMLMVFPSFVINPSLRRVSYDPIKDFRAVGQIGFLPMAIAVHPSVPAKSLRELIALARAKPGEVAYGSPGSGTLHHVVGEMFKLAVKVNIIHVPYKGGGPSLTALAGGHVPMIVTNVSTIAAFAQSGKVRALIVTTRDRVEALPDVPTIRESGYPDLESLNWNGFVVPGSTPPSAIARLNTELARALRAADVQEKFKAQGLFASPGAPDPFTALLQSESTRYARVVREAGIKVD